METGIPQMILSNTNHPQLDRIHVSSLGSFVFCPRAGVIAFKLQDTEEVIEEPRVPNLSYLPLFDEDALEQKFSEVWRGVLLSWIIIIASGIVLWLIANFGSLMLAMLLCLALIPIAWVAFRDTSILISILVELFRYKQAKSSPLNASLNAELPITWWGLIKAGYKPNRGSAMTDKELNLSGNPWRFLSSHDGERIPVIGITGEKLEVRDSHRAKLAAYCHLFETQQRAMANWGILLHFETRKGIAIPIGVLLRDRVNQHLKDFRTILDDHRFKKDIPIPVKPACQNCPFGRPHLYSLNGSETPYPHHDRNGANTTLGKTNQLVHSDCGDEFHWLPPHRYWQPDEN